LLAGGLLANACSPQAERRSSVVESEFCPDDTVVLLAEGLLANAYPPKADSKEIRGSAERARTIRAAELSLAVDLIPPSANAFATTQSDVSGLPETSCECHPRPIPSSLPEAFLPLAFLRKPSWQAVLRVRS
jgi:hypothetical protein